MNPFEQALKDAALTKDDIQKVILVGGPTRMPIVQKFIEDHIGKKVERGIDPMECVATGAAIQGAILGGEITDMVLLDVTPLTLGLETLGECQDRPDRPEHHNPDEKKPDILYGY